MHSTDTAKQIAAKLLEIEAVKLRPDQPFTWASGWLSPIYCDNRKTLSYPAVRYAICEGLSRIVEDKFDGIEVVAAVATAGIPHGVLLAHALSLPFVYVRSSAKDHGMGNQIEGHLPAGARTIVIEDLISSGKSSLAAVDALRQAGAQVEGLLAIFSYGFDTAVEAFRKAACTYYTLTDYHHLIAKALETSYITSSQMDTLEAWRKDPAGWNK